MPGPVREKPPGLDLMIQQALSGIKDFGSGLMYSPTEPMPEDASGIYATGAAVGAMAPFLGVGKGVLGGIRGGHAGASAIRGLRTAAPAEVAASTAARTAARVPSMQVVDELPVRQMSPGMDDVNALIGQMKSAGPRIAEQQVSRVADPVQAIRQTPQVDPAWSQSTRDVMHPSAQAMQQKMYEEAKRLVPNREPYNRSARYIRPDLTVGTPREDPLPVLDGESISDYLRRSGVDNVYTTPEQAFRNRIR